MATQFPCEKTPAGNIRTCEVRVAGPFNIHKANEKGKFTMRLLFPKDADLTLLKQMAAAAAKDKFGEDWQKKGLKSPFRDQGEKSYDGYTPGAVFLNVSSGRKPAIVDVNVQPLGDESAFYPGAWARVTVNAFAYDKEGNRGVAFGLQAIQKIRDDERFGGVNIEEEFAPVATGESDFSQGAADMFD